MLCFSSVNSTVPGSFDKGVNFHLAANKSKRSKGGLGIHFQDLNKKNDRQGKAKNYRVVDKFFFFLDLTL